MKFSVTFKDPDVANDAIRDAAKEQTASMGLPKDEADALAEMRAEKAYEAIAKWMDYGEYITIDFDTEAMTATVRARE